MTKSKILNLCLVFTSLLGYLEWGTDSKAFLYQIEIKVLSDLFNDPGSLLHPLVLLPLLGQVLLLITLFQKKPNRLLTFLGIGGIGVLLLFVFAISVMNLNLKTLVSTLPFLGLGIYTVWYHRKGHVGSKE